MAFRVDKGSLRSPVRTPDGRLRVDGVLTRAGVFTYRNPDGTSRREYRPADEVFRVDSLSSFAGAPLTNDHPTEPVTPANARRYAVGAVGDSIRRDGDNVVAPISVFDAATIAAMDAGKVALSCGYEVDLVEEPGTTPSGERYDAVQTNIRGNHVALVDVGRAGPEARVRMDAAIQTEEVDMELLAKALEQVAAEKLRADTAEKALAEANARAAKLEGERDNEKARADAAEKARADAETAAPAAVRARIELETRAAQVLGADQKFEGMTDRAIKCAVVEKVTGVKLGDERHDEYVASRYDGAIEQADRSKDALAGARARTAPRTDATDGGASKARADMIDHFRNAWKPSAN